MSRSNIRLLDINAVKHGEVMDWIIGTAHAQSDVVASTEVVISAWVYVVAGVFLAAVTLVLVMKDKTVSTGHAILFGAAVALIAIPKLASFEWSEDSFKFTTRDQSTKLASIVGGLVTNTAALQEEQKSNIEILRALTERLAALELTLAQEQANLGLNSDGDDSDGDNGGTGDRDTSTQDGQNSGGTDGLKFVFPPGSTFGGVIVDAEPDPNVFYGKLLDTERWAEQAISNKFAIDNSAELMLQIDSLKEDLQKGPQF